MEKGKQSNSSIQKPKTKKMSQLMEDFNKINSSFADHTKMLATMKSNLAFTKLYLGISKENFRTESPIKEKLLTIKSIHCSSNNEPQVLNIN